MLCIVQARSSSKRLPDKIFKKIDGKSVIERVLIRLKKSKEITKIVFATSNRNNDNRVENFCLNNKIICYRGDLNNVALRYFNLSSHRCYFAKYLRAHTWSNAISCARTHGAMLSGHRPNGAIQPAAAGGEL